MLLTLALTPVYVSYLGMGSYGLIGILVLVQGIAMMFEFGLPLALIRSIAKLRATPKGMSQISELFKSFEIVFWFFALLMISISMTILWMAPELIHSSSLSDSVILFSLMLIFLQISFRFPLIIYQSVFTGFERIVDLSLFSAIFISIRLVGSAALLVLFGVNIIEFFLYQLIVLILEVLFLRRFCWKMQGLNIKTKFSIKRIYSEIKFIKISFFATLLGVFLSQFDKLVLTSVLSLEDFGQYSLIVLFGSAIIVLGYPIGSVSFPVLSKSVQSQSLQRLARGIRSFLNLKFVLILPIGLFLMVYAKELIPFYLGNNMSSEFIDIVPIYMLGAIFGALIPFFNGLILSSDSPENAPKALLAMSLFYLPALLLLVNIYGVVGASYGFLLMQLGLFCLYVLKCILIFKRLNILTIVANRLIAPGASIFLVLYLAKFWLNENIASSGVSDLFFMLSIYVLVQLVVYMIWRRVNAYDDKYNYEC